ncbi:TIGR04222 domain-containing membrane protein [Streptomyces bambusae]|uniref:TIGR04222 domain-containing membrane protein n=1 Tax=Streptomyces bambusae TaxID=1550616 RepID=UPI001CFF9F9A|nr:TIGR04222 domain-containing membrane protein [Streptomyces bambusae]MCB5169155.1 TIGR04222 domain-containing membrane protein [Streptomyces bambusae]
MGVLLWVCAGVMAVSCAYRAGFWLWAQCPPVTAARPEGVPLSLYEVAALKADEEDPRHLATTLVEAMVESGILGLSDGGRLRAGTRPAGGDPLHAAVLADLPAQGGLRPWELRERVAQLAEVRALERELAAAGLVTRSRNERSFNVHLTVVVAVAAVGALVLISTRSPLGTGVLAGLVALGSAVVRLCPERRGNASRRGRRLLAGLNAVAPRPTLGPGLVLYDRQHAAFTLMALYKMPVTGLFRSGGSSTSGAGGAGGAGGGTVHEGPGLGGL